MLVNNLIALNVASTGPFPSVSISLLLSSIKIVSLAWCFSNDPALTVRLTNFIFSFYEAALSPTKAIKSSSKISFFLSARSLNLPNSSIKALSPNSYPNSFNFSRSSA